MTIFPMVSSCYLDDEKPFWRIVTLKTIGSYRYSFTASQKAFGRIFKGKGVTERSSDFFQLYSLQGMVRFKLKGTKNSFVLICVSNTSFQ